MTKTAAKPTLLFLAHLLPWPLDGGGQIKSFHTLRILATRFNVTLLAFIRRASEANEIGPLRALCAGGVETVLVPRGRARNAVQAARALVRRQSFIVTRDDVPAMRQAVEKALRRTPFTVIHVDHLQMAQFVPPGAPGAPSIVLDQHNIEHRIPQRIGDAPGARPHLRWFSRREWPRLRDFEIAMCRRADLVLTVSDEDAMGLVSLAPDLGENVLAVPIGVDTDYFGVVRRTPGARTLLSIGTMFWPPNVDSMLYFCADVLPKIKQAVPGVHLNIVGARPTPVVQALAGENVTVTGSVPDVRTWAADCGAFVVPLRSGSGMRVKILNAMAMGLPIVSTTLGAEGIEARDGEHLLLADGAEAFASAVVRVLGDEQMARRLGEAGRRLMAERYAWDRVGEQLLEIYDRRVLSTR